MGCPFIFNISPSVFYVTSSKGVVRDSGMVYSLFPCSCIPPWPIRDSTLILVAIVGYMNTVLSGLNCLTHLKALSSVAMTIHQGKSSEVHGYTLVCYKLH